MTTKHSIKTHMAGNQCLTIEIRGSFSFELVTEFRQAYEGCDKPVRQYVVDLGGCVGITSAGLGMLLQMQRWVDDKQASIHLTSCNDSIVSILHLSKFDQIFTVNPHK